MAVAAWRYEFQFAHVLYQFFQLCWSFIVNNMFGCCVSHSSGTLQQCLVSTDHYLICSILRQLNQRVVWVDFHHHHGVLISTIWSYQEFSCLIWIYCVFHCPSIDYRDVHILFLLPSELLEFFFSGFRQRDAFWLCGSNICFHLVEVTYWWLVRFWVVFVKMFESKKWPAGVVFL